jgi:hypothetical protein
VSAHETNHRGRELEWAAPVFAEPNERNDNDVLARDTELLQNEECTEYPYQRAVAVVQCEY